ncbi:MAG: 3-oxoacyl-ACP reductase FabG [Pseudomonadota bacterium]
MKNAVLVTGGSRGIGKAICQVLARRGWIVLVNYQKNEQAALAVRDAIREGGGESEIFQADVADREQVKAMLAQIKERGYWVNALVNNAGITRDKLLPMMSGEEWESVIATNLNSAFYCIKEVIQKMIVRKNGCIVNVASVSGIRGQAGQSNYGAAKAGMLALTRSLAREVGRYNIRVNAVAPGFIDTDMLTAMSQDESIKAMLEETRNNHVPLKRFGKAEEVANVVSFLLSAEASYMTGQAIVVDGGLTL